MRAQLPPARIFELRRRNLHALRLTAERLEASDIDAACLLESIAQELERLYRVHGALEEGDFDFEEPLALS
jgi:hypothetical protein